MLMPAGMRATGLLQNKVPENQVKKEVAENLRLGDFQQLFWIGKPPALPVEVPRKKALASSNERSELLTAN